MHSVRAPSGVETAGHVLARLRGEKKPESVLSWLVTALRGDFARASLQEIGGSS